MEKDINVELMDQIRSVENMIKRSRQNILPQGYGRILHAIYRNSGVSQSELAEILDVRPQSLTRALSQLEKDGYIARNRSEDDRRNITVNISEKGIEHHKKVVQLRKKRADSIFSCLDDRQKMELKELLAAVLTDTEGDKK